MTLCACETGVGEVKNGDGIYGLRRALVLAGAETQMMSLWKVDDHATEQLMTGYYSRLLKGGGRSDALREVQLEMLATSATAPPFYWASFIVSGDERTLEGKAAPPVRAVSASMRPVERGTRGCACDVGAAGGSSWSALGPALGGAMALWTARRARRRVAKLTYR